MLPAKYSAGTSLCAVCAGALAVLSPAPSPVRAAEDRCDSYAEQYNSATEHLKADEFYEAITELSAVINFDWSGNCAAPAKGRVRFSRGLAYSRTGDFGAAITDFKRAVGQNGALKAEIMPHLLNAYRARGSEAFQKGDYDRAIEDFTEVLFLEPEDNDTREARRQVYRERGKARQEGRLPAAPERGKGNTPLTAPAPAAPGKTSSRPEVRRGPLPALIAALFAFSGILFWLQRRPAKGRPAAGSGPVLGSAPGGDPAPAMPQAGLPETASSPARRPRGPAVPAGAGGPGAIEIKALMSEEKYEEARDLLARKKRLGLPDYELFLEIYIRLDDFMRAELTANQVAGALRDGLVSDCDYALYLSLSDECRAKGEDALASRLRGIAVDWMLQALSVREEPKRFHELAAAMEKEGETEQALKIYRRLAELEPPWPGAAEQYKNLKKRPAALAQRTATPPPQKTAVQAPSLVLDDRYELKNTLGEGGMGVVFEAWDRQLKRRTAVKRMHAWLKQYPAEYSRFRKEAELVARLRHPNIIGVHGVVEHGGEIYLVFDYVDGRPLSEALREKKRLPLKESLDILKDVCGAVDHAHRTGVIHRDLKPGNIMLERGGRALVMDFGLASELRDSFSRVSHDTVSGTPAYMAPEQHSGVVKRESDIYSLGVCLYEMLTGELPFQGVDILGQKLRKEYKEVSGKLPWLPAGVDAALDRALQPEPSQRYARAPEFYEALKEL